MPQKPQDRARDKRRLTKRLAKWREQQALKAQPQEPKAAPKPAAQG